MKNQKNGNLNTQIERYFAIKIRPSLKMQKIIKQRSSVRELFETGDFAFMKIFDLLVKIVLLNCSTNPTLEFHSTIVNSML